jgi:hypothetical protein
MDPHIEVLATGIRDRLGALIATLRTRAATPDFELTARAALGSIQTRLDALTTEAETLDANIAEARE